ncbi:DUF488 domain-containing protein [Alicyclobacillus sendaiensis]|nr:DUF488 domain-containing protein [Alicyclobacillus sendaiensis]
MPFALKRGRVTLACAARDPVRNHARVLPQDLESCEP